MRPFHDIHYSGKFDYEEFILAEPWSYLCLTMLLQLLLLLLKLSLLNYVV